MNGRTDNGTRITSNYQNALIPTSNTMLGLLMRDGYPAGAGIAGQPSGDGGNRGDGRPYFFTKLFQSSNDYVLVYKVNYPPTPILTAKLGNPYAPAKSANNITGTLTYNGQPVTSKTQVILQYAEPGGGWTMIPRGNVTLTSGTYQVNWTPTNNVGPIHVRAWWNGDPTVDLNMVLSANQTLIQT